MNVLVTGATGFVGAHLVPALLARGDAVTCLVRTPAKAAARGWTGVRLVTGGLDDAAALREACTGAEVIYHLAGLISARNLTEFMATNRDRTGELVDTARAVAPAARFVYVSTLAAGGPTVAGRPIDEQRPPAPVTDYGRSKLAGEVLVRAAPLPWTIVRPPVVYGEWDREVLKVFSLAQRGLGPVFGDGSQELSIVYAGDLAAALIAAGSAASSVGRVYYAAHPAVITSRELVLAVGRSLGTSPTILPLPAWLARGALWAIGSLAHLAGRATLLSADKANEFLAPAWTCSAAALTRDTGWVARTDLATGLTRTATWYRTNGWL